MVKLRSNVQEEKEPTRRSTNAEAAASAVRKCLQNMKESNPPKYREFRAKESNRLRDFRKKLSAATRAKYNEKSKQRMRKARERKKEAAGRPVQEQHRVTRTQVITQKQKQMKQREYWKSKKRDHRSKITSQKKRRIKEKDRQRKQEERENLKKTPLTSARTDPFCSEAARRQALSRCKSKIPRSSEKYATILHGLIETASPTKRDALEQRGIHIVNAKDAREAEVLLPVRNACGSFSRRQRRSFVHQIGVNLKQSRHGTKAKICRMMGFRRNYLKRYVNLQSLRVTTRSDALNADTRTTIEDFYTRPDVSTELPNKKAVSKQSKPKHVLQRSLEETFKNFKTTHPAVTLSKSKFTALRPMNVVVQSQAKWIQCLCEYCENMDLKIKEINKCATSNKQTCKIKDRYHASDLTMCDNSQTYRDINCIDRKCSDCGVQQMGLFLKPVLDCAGSSDVTWRKWGTSFYKGKPKKSILRVSGTLQDLVSEIQNELKTFSAHLFQARWQQSQFSSIIRNPPAKSVVLVMDFAENFTCTAQREVQSAHWTQTQVTLHPMVAFYRCNTCDRNDPVRETIDIISDDLVHDAHAVDHFVKAGLWYLVHQRGVDVSRLIQWSDGCGCQYKSRTPFMDISCFAEDTSLESVERHFFGSRHGKSPCDGEGGVVKSSVTRSVKSEDGVVITDSSSFHQLCNMKLARGNVDEDGNCHHSRRKFLLVEKQDINRDRPERTNVTTLQGTRKLHVVVGLGASQLNTRRLSCFCDSCEESQGKETAISSCINSTYVSSWKKKKLKKPGEGKALKTGTAKKADMTGRLTDDEELSETEEMEVEVPTCKDSSSEDKADANPGPTCKDSSSEDKADANPGPTRKDLSSEDNTDDLSDHLVAIMDEIQEILEDPDATGHATGLQHIGDWCVVTYDGVMYPGVVEDIVGRDFKVSVMVKAGKSLWRWPDPPDCVWYECKDVIREIEPPELIGSRGLYKFFEGHEP